MRPIDFEKNARECVELARNNRIREDHVALPADRHGDEERASIEPSDQMTLNLNPRHCYRVTGRDRSDVQLFSVDVEATDGANAMIAALHKLRQHPEKFQIADQAAHIQVDLLS
jgi:hypothetical protein